VVSLCLLGNPRVEGPSGPVTGHATQRRPMALLALLATAGRAGWSRDKLVALLWPESPPGSARHSLADTVYRLRKALGEGSILGEGETLRLNPEVIHTDVHAFEASLVEGRQEDAASLYGGAFLDGFHLAESHEFEDWREGEARRLRGRFESALEEMAHRAEATGDWQRAGAHWARLAGDDPFNTRFVLGWMRALAGSGDTGNAIRLGEEHIRRLRSELQAEPTSQLLALLEGLRTGALAPPSPTPPPEPTGCPQDLPFRGEAPEPGPRAGPAFVGRERELARLGTFLDRALAGEGCVAFVTGDAGTGKTALAVEFCRRSLSAHPELVVARGNGNAHTGPGDPYLPFREILALLTGDVEARYVAGSLPRDPALRLWNLIPVSVGALLDVGPDLVDTFLHRARVYARVSAFAQRHAGPGGAWASLPRDPPAQGHPPQQPALFLQFVRTLQAVARARPLLLVLDDLQWADAGSLDLLFQLGRALEGSRILVLGFYRPLEVALGREGRRHTLESVVNEMRRTFGDVEVALGEGGDRALLDALVDAEPNELGEAFRTTLFRQTGGNALFTVELLGAMREKGALARDAAGRWREGPSLRWDILPARVEAVIAERLARLPRPLQRALAVASVDGELFCLEAVAAALGVGADELLATMTEEAEKVHRLVRVLGIRRLDHGRQTTYRFNHILFQRFLYGRLGQVERAEAHQRLGEAWEALGSQERDDISLQLARHFREAGAFSKAVDYLRQAGEGAKRTGAYKECTGAWREALRLLESLPGSRSRDRMEMDLLLDLCHEWWGEFLEPEEMERYLARAHALATRLEDRAHLFSALLAAFVRSHFLGEQDRCRTYLDQAEPWVAGSVNAEEAFLFRHYRALNSLNRARFAEALQNSVHAESLYEPEMLRSSSWCGHPGWLPVLHALRGIIYCCLGYAERAYASLEKARVLACAEDAITWLHIHYYEAIVDWFSGNGPGAEVGAEATRALAAEVGASAWEAFAAVIRGWALAERGSVDDGVRAIRTALGQLDRQGWMVWRPYVEATLADALRRVGQAEEGLEMLDRGLATIERTGERIHEPEVNRIRGEVLLAPPVPDEEGAEGAFRRARDVARAQEARLFELRATVSIARLLHAQGRSAEALLLLRETYDWFTEGFDTRDLREAADLLEVLEAGS